MISLDAVILGAGPYGLAAGAHLRTIRGFETRTFGEPMSFWSTSMPKGMLLRSSWEASHIADPDGALTLDGYRVVNGNHLSAPVSLERFVDYGLWFHKRAVPEIERKRIASIEKDAGGFRVTLEDGEEIRTRRIIVAAGIAPFAYRPPQFNGLPASLVSHTSEYHDLHDFRSKHVVVIGGGQSALETAALLHESGADVEVITRAPQIHWLGWKTRLHQLGPVAKLLYSWTDVGPAGVSRIVSSPHLLRQFPRTAQDKLRRRSIRPAGAHWLPERLKSVRMTFSTRVRNRRFPTASRRLRVFRSGIAFPGSNRRPQFRTVDVLCLRNQICFSHSAVLHGEGGTDQQILNTCQIPSGSSHRDGIHEISSRQSTRGRGPRRRLSRARHRAQSGPALDSYLCDR